MSNFHHNKTAFVTTFKFTDGTLPDPHFGLTVAPDERCPKDASRFAFCPLRTLPMHQWFPGNADSSGDIVFIDSLMLREPSSKHSHDNGTAATPKLK